MTQLHASTRPRRPRRQPTVTHTVRRIGQALILGCTLIVSLAAAQPAQRSAAAASAPRPAATAPRNVIILFADGVASTQWEFGRYSSEVLRKQPFAVTQHVFGRGTLGLMNTTPTDAIVTDSAAAATAMSIGRKTSNGMVGVLPNGAERPTLLETAKARGKKIGLITTATVYDASPAAFSVHARERGQSQLLVDQYLKLEPDLLMGGGADYFLPKDTAGGKRTDARNVLDAFAAKGYQIARKTGELAGLRPGRVLGLFADTDMDFELDREPAEQPSTAEMTRAALAVLSRSSPKGFVLLVENENTDTAGHRTDAASLMHALWAFDDAVKVALEFRQRHPDTLVIVTGDHETGGFSPTYAQRDATSLSSRNRFYATDAHLAMLSQVNMSLEELATRWARNPTTEHLNELVAKHLPGFTLDNDLRDAILAKRTPERNFTYVVQNNLGRMIARQTGFYWGTSGHTIEPIVVGAVGPGAQRFGGYQANSDFATHLVGLIR